MKQFWKSILAWMIVLHVTQLHADADPLLQLNTGGPTAPTRSILLNSDESLLVAAGDDKVVRVWNTNTGKQSLEIRGQVADDIEGAITTMALSPDDRWLAVAIFFPHQSGGIEKRGYLRIHDFSTGDLVGILEGHTKAMHTLSFSSDGRMLLAGESLDDSPKAIIWDTSSWKVRQEFIGHKEGIRSATFTPRGDQILTASWDRSIKVWDVATGKNIKTIRGAHDGRIYSVVVPRNAAEPIAITGGTDKTVKIWNYQTGKKIRTIKFDRKIRQVIANSTGTRLLAASVGEHVNSWIAVVNSNNGRTLAKYKGHDRFSLAMTLSSDDETVYSGGGFQHEIDRWSLTDTQRVRRIVGTGRPVQAVGISSDGNSIFWGHTPINWSGKTYSIDKLAKLSMQIELETVHGQLGRPQPINKRGTKIQRTVRKAGKLSLKRTRPKEGGFFSVLEIKRSGKTIGKIERDKRTGHVHTAYTFTPDQKAVITGAEIGYLSIHDLKGEKLGDFKGHNGDITDLAVSEDGTLLVSGSRDQTFKLWNLQTQEMLLSFFVADNGEWIAWTSTGHYTSSPDGDRYIGWVLNRGADQNSEYVRAEQMKKKLYRPDVIQKVLSNRSLNLALSTSPQSDFSVIQVQEAKVVPVDFQVLSPQDGAITDADAINLKVQVTANVESDIDWSVSVNNRQILNPSATRGLARTQPAGKSLTFPLLLDPGENQIRIIAGNNETEKEVHLVVNRTVTQEVATKGTSGDKLLVISVGVDEYVNLPEHSLRFASADASAISRLFIEQEGKNYDRVESIILSDSAGEPPTRDNVVDALDALADLGPADTVILFLAGHGIIEDSDYYFLPRDATLRSSDRWKKSTVIAWSEIQRAMQASLGRRILLVDTCHAESAFNSRLIKDAEDSNIIVMSSTDSTTLAQEVASLGHGVFTYALVSGIEGEADSYKDGRVTMSELNAFVANAVPSITKNAQIPTLSVPGGFQDFVIASL